MNRTCQLVILLESFQMAVRSFIGSFQESSQAAKAQPSWKIPPGGQNLASEQMAVTRAVQQLGCACEIPDNPSMPISPALSSAAQVCSLMSRPLCPGPFKLAWAGSHKRWETKEHAVWPNKHHRAHWACWLLLMLQTPLNWLMAHSQEVYAGRGWSCQAAVQADSHT